MKNAGPNILDHKETSLQGWISRDGINRRKGAGGALVNIESQGKLAIQPGETRSISGNAVVDAPGVYYIIVDVDHSNTVQETDEANNSLVSTPITVRPSKPVDGSRKK